MKVLLGVCMLLATAYAVSIHVNEFDEIIKNANSAQTTWKSGHNFARTVGLSYIKRLLGAKKTGRSLPLREKHDLPDSAIPETFDSRLTWPNCPTISQVKDQGNCGSCWAVAAAATFSDRLCIASNGSFTAPLSEEELLSCCPSCGMGCDGGNDIAAWLYFMYHGIVTGGDYNSNVGCQPYEVESCEHHTTGSLPSCDTLPDADTPKCLRKCSNPSYEVSFEKDNHKTKNAYSVSSRVTEIQKEILTHGPVEAGFSVYDDFPTYKSGVYKRTSFNAMGGHAVRVIGWGTENGTPYWLIANSWNTAWGDKGLFKILRGGSECGIEDQITAGVPIV